MEHFKSVCTLSNTTYRVGEKLGIPTTEVSDISIGWDDEQLLVAVWTKEDEYHDEVLHILIPYHAVELLVKS